MTKKTPNHPRGTKSYKGPKSKSSRPATRDKRRSPELVAELEALGAHTEQEMKVAEQLLVVGGYRNVWQDMQFLLHLAVSWELAFPRGIFPANELDSEGWATLKTICDTLLDFLNRVRKLQREALCAQLATDLAAVYERVVNEDMDMKPEEDLVREVCASRGIFFSDDPARFDGYRGPGSPAIFPVESLAELALNSEVISKRGHGEVGKEAARKALIAARIFDGSEKSLWSRQQSEWPRVVGFDAPPEFFGVKLTEPMIRKHLEATVLSSPTPWTAFGVEREDGKRAITKTVMAAGTDEALDAAAVEVAKHLSALAGKSPAAAAGSKDAAG